MEKHYQFAYDYFDSIDDLTPEENALIQRARQRAHHAYVPYSNFGVAAVGLLENGMIVESTNQENASYPVGICAERVLLSTISSVHPDIRLLKMAISYYNPGGKDQAPIAPCGMCRQALQEQQLRFGQPVLLLLSGQEGSVIRVKDSMDLLPFHFSATDLRG
ncbi:cytidine deaminase [Arachidicoccus terrestris]|jgi:cytidine deaminase|uniref:cytidine deaminase n=1 Tax=Arachidicoccus terrestris TaxID=2875539 RepID=UPI001CC41907|nr:cytidine deaminase [Arachidicoccus terrestris]UAY54506.1 cytidine deaminase [Arachidicoccus terrestris]